MSHFAKINDESIVVDVIVAEQDFIDSGVVGDPASWLQTSYNTRGGIHYGPDGKPDGGFALRKNYAGIGYTYNSVIDGFVPPKPYPSWVLNVDTGLWDSPIPYPSDGQSYYWDENVHNWVLVPKPPVIQPVTSGLSTF